MSESPEHLVKSYDQELKRLGNLIAEMGGIVESQVADAAEAIMQRDTEMAARVVEADPKVDAIEREVEQFVIRLLALRQPMAGDLRNIVAALKITTDLDLRRGEREGRRQGNPGLALRPGYRRSVQHGIPRAGHLHDGRSAQHHALHAPAVHRQESGTNRRSCDQYRRDRALRGDRPAAHRGTAER